MPDSAAHPLSAHLPANFDPTRPVGLIAGQGRYPRIAAAAMRARGVPVRLIAMEGETTPELVADFPEAHRVMLRVGQLGHMLKALTSFGVGYAYMAGQVTPRRLFRGLHPDLKAARILFSLKERNAETIFGAIANEIEALGVHLLDARAFLDDHLALAGPMTGRALPIREEHLRHGVHIAREIARLDIGQGCVVRKGTVIAVEAFEGTDAMLRRAGGFKADGCLFVKTVKRGQDYRFDVPVFGSRTLETMREAGIRCAALEAGRVIMLDRDALLAEARDSGVHLHGFE